VLIKKMNQEPRNGASGTSDIEGKAARVAANKRGERVSFKATKRTKADFELQKPLFSLLSFVRQLSISENWCAFVVDR
jgi:hypothetical protein